MKKNRCLICVWEWRTRRAQTQRGAEWSRRHLAVRQVVVKDLLWMGSEIKLDASQLRFFLDFLVTVMQMIAASSLRWLRAGMRFRWHLSRRTMCLSICIRATDVWLHLCNLSLLELLLSFISVCLPHMLDWNFSGFSELKVIWGETGGRCGGG